MIKRIFDFCCALVGLLLLAPFILICALAIFFDDPKGSPFYFQIRVGQKGREFALIKFRSMYVDSGGRQITVGDRDPRITRVGYFIRKFKLDELPQLWNVLKGDMSLVGPRPEVPRYVALYNAEQRKVLDLKPGITDLASLVYFKEAELLRKSPDPENTYIREIMPEKLRLNRKYQNERKSILDDIRIIYRTLLRMLS